MIRYGDLRSEAPEQLEGVRRVHHRYRRYLRPGSRKLSHGKLAGLDHGRGHPEAPGRDGARDRPQAAHDDVGAADPLGLREGVDDPLRRPQIGSAGTTRRSTTRSSPVSALSTTWLT